MKTASLLFLSMSCAALTQGPSYTAPSQQTSAGPPATTPSNHSRDDHPNGVHASPGDDQKPSKERNPTDEPRYLRHASDKKSTPGRASVVTVIHPKMLPNSRQRSIADRSAHPPGLDKSGGAARGGFIQNKILNNAPPVRKASVVRSTAAPLNNVRDRGSNPAAIGGPASLYSGNAGEINGTRMLRRP